uniref:Uncharacterized protein n=1 Tax=viral metagenome TaxID=1070528 RepID=A0A6C0IH02_9ZZZZ
MACPSDVTTGFVTIQGPIQQSDLDGITVKRHPLTTSFSPRTSEPTIFNKNYIDDTVGSTCIYKSSRYNLSDIQLVQPIHTGYILPGYRQTPKAELILSFSANTPALSLANYSGILMCVPIYDSGAPSHDAYLNQLIDTTTPLCKHTRNPGKDCTTDTNTKAKRTLQNTTLTECINAACNDSKCVAYTYKNKTSYLYYEIPKETNTTNQDIISGTIDHTTAPVITNTCSTNNTNTPPQLESIFNHQSSFAYKTCFETVDSTKVLESHGLYVIVFPKGITMASANYVLLSTKIGNPSRYRCPVSIRGPDPTLLTYRFDDSGNKTSVTTSSDGYIYTSPLSSCTAEFRDRIEFFEHAPKPTSSSSSSSSTAGNAQCKYTRKQYKCVPLNKVNELHEGDIASGKSIDDCIKNQDIPATSKSSETSVEEMEVLAGVVGSVVVVVMGALVLHHFWPKKSS